MKETNLSEIMFSEQAIAAWNEMADRVKIGLRLIGKTESVVFPTKARLNNDGTLTILMEVHNFLQTSMIVPAGHWIFRQ